VLPDAVVVTVAPVALFLGRNADAEDCSCIPKNLLVAPCLAADTEYKPSAAFSERQANVIAPSKVTLVSAKKSSVPSNNKWSNNVPLLAIFGCFVDVACVAPLEPSPDWLYQVWTKE
jgi:hypothetical protein